MNRLAGSTRRALCSRPAAGVVLGAWLLWPGSARAATLVVDADQGPYRTVQEALATAAAGDVVEVAPGEWTGPFDLAWRDPARPDDGGGATLGPAVTLRSRDGAVATRLKGGDGDFVVRLGPGSSLIGFTVRGAQDGVRAVAMEGADSAVLVSHNLVEAQGSYGVHVAGGGPSRVEANRVSQATTAGILLTGEAQAVANWIEGVRGDGLRLGTGAGAALNNVVCNTSRGIATESGFVGDLRNNDVVKSTTGIEVSAGAQPASLLMNVVALSDLGLACSGDPASAGYNARWELNGTGSCAVEPSDLEGDPLFADLREHGEDCSGADLHLKARSTLVDAGHPAYADLDGTRADIGAFGGVEAALWDIDDDGYLAGEDCDDFDSSISPAAPEVCFDELDNDCDGHVDDLTTTCFAAGPDLEGLYCASGGTGVAPRRAPWLAALLLVAVAHRRRTSR